MTHKEKDAVLAHLRDELQRERAAHTDTRKMLSDAMALLLRPASVVLPIVQPQQPIPGATYPWLSACEDCQRSSTGRCWIHPIVITYPTTITYPFTIAPNVH